jgi:hypothetical protein
MGVLTKWSFHCPLRHPAACWPAPARSQSRAVKISPVRDDDVGNASLHSSGLQSHGFPRVARCNETARAGRRGRNDRPIAGRSNIDFYGAPIGRQAACDQELAPMRLQSIDDACSVGTGRPGSSLRTCGLHGCQDRKCSDNDRDQSAATLHSHVHPQKQPPAFASRIVVWPEAALINPYMRLSRWNFNSVGEASLEVIRGCRGGDEHTAGMPAMRRNDSRDSFRPLSRCGGGSGSGQFQRHRLATRAPSPTLPRKREREQKSRAIT